jgi:uncharacterized protein YndB with AHSA1/START domain
MPNIRHNLLIGASAEKIYNAITSEEGLSAWWTPNTKVKLEVNSVARFPFGTDYYKEMKITKLKPDELVEWNCITGDAEWVGTNISFTLLSGNKKNLLNTNPEVSGQIFALVGLPFKRKTWCAVVACFPPTTLAAAPWEEVLKCHPRYSKSQKCL